MLRSRKRTTVEAILSALTLTRITTRLLPISPWASVGQSILLSQHDLSTFHAASCEAFRRKQLPATATSQADSLGRPGTHKDSTWRIWGSEWPTIPRTLQILHIPRDAFQDAFNKPNQLRPLCVQDLLLVLRRRQPSHSVFLKRTKMAANYAVKSGTT